MSNEEIFPLWGHTKVRKVWFCFFPFTQIAHSLADSDMTQVKFIAKEIPPILSFHALSGFRVEKIFTVITLNFSFVFPLKSHGEL